MSNKFKTILLTVVVTGFIFSSATAFAVKLVPGTTEPCEQLWLVNDVDNADLVDIPDVNGGTCIDVPVNLKKVKVLFNLDNALTSHADSVTPVGLRHLALLGDVMQDRIAKGLIESSNIEIVGIIHGEAMSKALWPFKNNYFPGPSGLSGMPADVKFWVDKIFAHKNAGINIQLEVCGVTLKGMQKKLKGKGAGFWHKMDERAIYTNDSTTDPLDSDPTDDGRILVNQGAVGRIIELQMNGFAYLQEE